LGVIEGGRREEGGGGKGGGEVGLTMTTTPLLLLPLLLLTSRVLIIKECSSRYQCHGHYIDDDTQPHVREEVVLEDKRLEDGSEDDDCASY